MISTLIIRVSLFAILATPLLSQAVGDSQQQVQAHSRQAQQYLRSNRPDLAIGEFKAILAIDAGNLDARGNAGVLEYFQGQYAKAAPDLRAALDINPSLWKLQALLGMSERRTGDNAKAQTDLEKAFPKLEEQKLRVQTGFELIEADYALSDLGKAAEVVNVLRQIEPTDTDVLYTAHRIYSELSDETMLSLAMVAPDSARMHQLMAHELARQAKDDVAIANYREALKIDPGRADVHYELAEILNTQSSPASRAEAEKEYKAALAGDPTDERSECRLGDIAARGSDLKDAASYYSRALEMQPNDPDAHLGMAKIQMSNHEPQKAVTHLERAAQIEPFNPGTHYRLGVVYRELGRADDSHREMTRFEELKKMKSRLGDLYQEMRLQPGKRDEPDSDVMR
jgi:tetratricopeptide (TPR) repeat protein